MADTGCQSCLVGIKAVSHLGLRAEDLIPVSMKMHAANNNSIKILGAVILQFSGKSASGNHMESRQITYVTDASDQAIPEPWSMHLLGDDFCLIPPDPATEAKREGVQEFLLDYY